MVGEPVAAFRLRANGISAHRDAISQWYRQKQEKEHQRRAAEKAARTAEVAAAKALLARKHPPGLEV